MASEDTMRDLVDCCPEAGSDCGEDRPKASVRSESNCYSVYAGNNFLASFDKQSDDFAYTNAVKVAERWNVSS